MANGNRAAEPKYRISSNEVSCSREKFRIGRLEDDQWCGVVGSDDNAVLSVIDKQLQGNSNIDIWKSGGIDMALLP